MKIKNVIQMLMVLSLMTLVSTTTSHAQKRERKTASERSERNLEWMKSNLNLTEAQIPQVKTILDERATRMDQVQAMSKADKKANKESLKTELQGYDDRLKAVLTDEQWTTYTAKKEDGKQKIKSRRRK